MSRERETLVRVQPDAMMELDQLRQYLESVEKGRAVSLSEAVRIACRECLDNRKLP